MDRRIVFQIARRRGATILCPDSGHDNIDGMDNCEAFMTCTPVVASQDDSISYAVHAMDLSGHPATYRPSTTRTGRRESSRSGTTWDFCAFGLPN